MRARAGCFVDTASHIGKNRAGFRANSRELSSGAGRSAIRDLHLGEIRRILSLSLSGARARARTI
jgi:hypothetical protein